MRDLYVEGDLISAEVQQFYGDGALSLHTRSLKYGKLANGQFLRVRPALIKRLKQHFVTLDCGVDLIMGLNGFIFITSHHDFRSSDTQRYSAEQLLRQKQVHAARRLSMDERTSICRVHNSILLLREIRSPITPERVMAIWAAAEQLKAHEPKMMLRPDTKMSIMKLIQNTDTGN